MIYIGNKKLDCSGILLDFDGTLVDSEPALQYLWAQICKENGLNLDRNHLANVIRGKPATEIINELFPNLTNVGRSQILAELEIKEELGPYSLMEGAYDFICKARSAGLFLGIVTSSWVKKVENVLFRHNIDSFFEVIVTREDVKQLKPSPEPYLLAVERTGMPRSTLIAIEDSRSGIMSARAAEVRCIGFGPDAMRNNYGSDYLAISFNDILPIPRQ